MGLRSIKQQYPDVPRPAHLAIGRSTARLHLRADLGTLTYLMASRGPRRPSSSDAAPRDPSATARRTPASQKTRQGGARGKRKLDDAAEVSPPPRPDDLFIPPDPLRHKLNVLKKEHDKLLREIQKKRAQLVASENLMRDIASSLAAQSAPIKQKLFEGVEAIQALFKGLLSATSQLNRRDKAKVRRVYEDIAEAFDLDITDDAPTPVDFGSDEGRHRGSSKGEHGFHDHSHGGGYSADKPSQNNASTLRALFRKLAIAFHPDKVQDEAAKAERTSLMKDMTRAYESGDLARLMEMERALLVRLPVEDDADSISRRVADLSTANAELRRQSRSLTSELKTVALGLPLDVNLKAPNASELAALEIASLIEDLEREERRVAALRDFVSDFAQGKMSLAAFLAGPNLPEEETDEEDEFERLQEELFMGFLDDLVRKSHRGGGRGKTSRRK